MAPRRTMMIGVARYMKEHQPWQIYLKPTFAERSLLEWIETWNGDGIIAVIHEKEKKSLRHVKIPIVDLWGERPCRDFPLVRTNDRLVGTIGAEHLLERGFTNFAFCEHRHQFWSRNRCEGFCARLKESGFNCHIFKAPRVGKGLGGPEEYERQQRVLIKWLENLPKPVGIMTTTDMHAQQVLEACMRIKAKVPDQIAVLGVDNDEPLCRISYPPLSSVIIDDHLRGYQAAALLDRLMAGDPKPTQPVLIDPMGVAARASTDIFAIDDPLLVNALKYMKEIFHTDVGVEDIAGKFQISRSLLERKFRKLLGRSIKDEIIRLRINNAIELLADTSLELKHIACRCGFTSQGYMTTIFKEKLGRTPGSFRQ